MVHGSTVLNRGVITAAVSWTESALRRSSVECKVEAAARGGPPADGARMEDQAIQLCVKRALGGEREALGELFAEYRADVLRFCTRMVGPNDCDDAANEVFHRAQQRLESFDTTQPFRRWLLAIASNHCIDRLRRRTVEKRLFETGESEDSSIDDFAARSNSALDGIIATERQASVQNALDELPDHYRVPLVLRYFAEMNYDAIGEEMGVKRAQVASLLFRGKQRLRAHFAGDRENES